jgi:uncharacterized membrane protein (UPF0127 family)
MEIHRLPVARTRWARLRGLAWRRRSRAGSGLVIPRCRSVHTIGMLFRLDLLFLDQRGRVVREVRAVGPGRIVGCREAVSVIELPSRRKRMV